MDQSLLTDKAIEIIEGLQAVAPEFTDAAIRGVFWSGVEYIGVGVLFALLASVGGAWIIGGIAYDVFKQPGGRWAAIGAVVGFLGVSAITTFTVMGHFLDPAAILARDLLSSVTK